MDCEILQTLYLKSNGEILCNDDSGEQVHLDRILDDGEPWSVSGFFANNQLQKISHSLQNGHVPWTGVCEHCAFLRTEQEFSPNLTKHISKFQIEPSLACRLRCPACSNHIQIRSRPKPPIMNLSVLEKALKSFVDEGYELDTVEYCGQGEPLQHPRFSSIVALVRDYLPNTRQRLITNGNFNYQETLAGVFLDEIIVSCDGVNQENYEKYRVGGSLEKALRFIEDCPDYVHGKKQTLIWKYILFSHNDSEEELIEAQECAQRIGVGTLLFVLTHSKGRSEKYTLETTGLLPIRYPNVTTNAHPSFYDGVRYGKSRRSVEELLSRLTSGYKWHIDEMAYFPGDVIHLRGWLAGGIPIDWIELRVDGEYVATIVPGEMREDVRLKFPGLNTERAGFHGSGIAPRKKENSVRLTLVVYAEGKKVAALSCHFDV